MAETPTPPPLPSAPPPGQQVVYVKAAGNGLATTALVLSIIAVVFGLVPIGAYIALPCGILAVIFGFMGRRRGTDPAIGGRTRATWGLALGALGTILAIIGIVIIMNIINDVDKTFNPARDLQPAAEPTVDDAPQTPALFNIGQPAANENLSVTVLAVTNVKPDEFTTVAAGNQLLAIQVRIENLALDDGLSTNSAEWTIVDEQGQSFDECICSSGKEPDLPLRELKPGEKATGWITFEVPKSGGLTALWAPGLETVARFTVRV